jgi:autotransporter adhesin
VIAETIGCVSVSEDAAAETRSGTVATRRPGRKGNGLVSAVTAVFGGLASSQVPALGTRAIIAVVAAGFVVFAPGAARGGGFICQDFNGVDGGAAFAAGSIRSTACGYYANSNGDYSTAIGQSAGAIADNSVALGYLANAGGYYNPSGGPTINYNNAFTTAIGNGAQAGASAVNQYNATALGASAQANAALANALGAQAQANGQGAIALGAGAKANYENSIAIGEYAETTRAKQVVLGSVDSTYTLAGITSQASTAAQAGPTYLVTTDSAGNLAASTFDVATLQNLPAEVAQNSTDITNLNSTVSSHTTQITANTTELADHETRITNNTTQIAANTTELADHETRITSNTNAIAVHTTEIADLDTRVTTNTSNITQLDGRVGALEAGVQDLGNQISENRTEARAGTALALATAGLRYDDRPEKLSLAGGFGYFKGQSGLALGLGYNTSEDFRLNAALSAATNHGDVGVSVGASWTLN